MGCCASQEVDGKHTNDVIENQLKNDRITHKNDVKMLLLGAGESGKSTLIKQMKLIHEGSYSVDEREAYREVIFSNAAQSMRVILEAMEIMEISLENEKYSTHVDIIMELPEQIEGESLASEITEAIKCLWADKGVQECFHRSREYQLNDSARYYFECIERIGQPNYIPNDQDVLRSRVKTTGMTETAFTMGEMTYRILDVGGQRSERKKWIHCFENVTAIVFMVAISEYDQNLIEDDTVNRMQEALTLFDSICNSRWFTKTSVLLFLNKIDLFREKLITSPMSDYFLDYDGGEDYDKACEFIANCFQSLNHISSKKIYTHFTCATDTQQIGFVMAAVNDIMIEDNLKQCGLL
ncbi:guanine nucleotide binding protein, alpha subunit [Basidiobolus meristosporus CBS 931.73]|uniref:Guanine nucleotide binding protein, alpha subunit n=1 Tax=Basidiobolus meristosporus CBS 931.73 TaxID=1314790 RepID=A0A1Y1XEB5_9FUNG|nr:guanine nucleotide binding protein, alpha subunit [Basidiobolus meristosporus CBS 931.73]|eukprot:ORX84063.1 guanine nucleotide binding protein, alpha subunit [Basidiobolus meristosporus CBS 931.73]